MGATGARRRRQRIGSGSATAPAALGTAEPELVSVGDRATRRTSSGVASVVTRNATNEGSVTHELSAAAGIPRPVRRAAAGSPVVRDRLRRRDQARLQEVRQVRGP